MVKQLPRRGPGLALLVALAAGLSGCQSKTIEDGPTYPTLSQARVLDVQVKREGTRITLTNTSPTALGPGRMWINQWFSRELEPVAPGQTVTLDLDEFRDRYGDSFRAGGFFATERPAKLVLVQVEQNNEIVGLVTVGDGATGL